MRYLALLGLLLVVLADAAESIIFPAHPRFLYTAEEIAAWKADPARQGELKSVITRADALLAQGLTVPEQEGDWIFYYACPKDGTRLRPETLEKHVCPKCAAVYTDERTRAAYRTQLNDQLNEHCITLGTAYALTGEQKYADAVKGVLLKLARLYPTWTRHDRWGRRGVLAVVGGRRYAQQLDEAYAAIRLARAYDLVANAIPVADRAVIEKGALGDPVGEIRRLQSFVGSKNNHQTWFNAAYAAVGVAIGDEALIRDSVDGPVGLRWQLKASVTDDGLWYEGTMAYQRYAMQAVMEHLDALKRVGITLADDARLKSMWTGPLNLAYPNGQFPVINDSDPASLDGWKDVFRWGYGYFNDPLLALYADIPVEGAQKPELKSANLAGLGIAVLRGGTPENPICVMMDYGQHGDHHGHPDKLNIVVYAQGQEWLLDPGRLTYSIPEYETWARTTVAHNTVVIDGKNQQPDTGKLLHFDTTPGYTAAFAISKGAYPGYTLKRFLILADDLLVDVFAVEGDKQAQFDWFMHGRGAITTPVKLSDRKKPLDDKAGYQHLAKLADGKGEKASVFTFTPPNGKPYRAYCLDADRTTHITGEGIGYNLNDKVPFLLRRQTGKTALFTTVYDLSGNDRALAIEPLVIDGQRNQQLISHTITPTNGKPYRFILDMGETPNGIELGAMFASDLRCAVEMPGYSTRDAIRSEFLRKTLKRLESNN
ncbi:MAG: Heparin-sulfate lyase precursor [bacterium ADurb.Bin429]|nr:MAG: Heparin-sulfate lyase precursor [bacterium ADurb.Bin429]